MEDEYSKDVEDDGLGYYEDGTKRTLSDEQIAIFRHSEIQALLRDRRHAAEAAQDEEDGRKRGAPLEKQNEVPESAMEKQEQGRDLEDGELAEVAEILNAELPSFLPTTKNQKSKKTKKEKTEKTEKTQRTEKAKQKSFFKQHIKPDLRKRTWDKVDTGLESLDYDEGDSSTTATRPAQRKRISYDDD